MSFKTRKFFITSIILILIILGGIFTAFPVQAANVFPIFKPYVNFPVGSGKAVGIGDFNSDGFPDVAMTTSTQLMVFLQNQDGSLANATAYAAGSRPESLAVGDVNRDSKTDIVAANYDSNTISVFLQQADGSFAARVTYVTNSGPDALAIGDINNDGLADIAVSHWTAANIGVFIQTSAGTISPMITYPSPQAGSDDISIADINHDGKNDLIKMNGQGLNPNLSVYLQNETGTLASAVSYSVTDCGSFCLSHGIGTGDVTGDGLTDIVVSYGGNRSTSRIAVFAQSQDGSLQSPVAYNAYDLPKPVEVADVNRDGLADVLVAHDVWNALSVFVQQNNGTLSDYSLYPIPYSRYQPQGLAVGDLNQDGLSDVAIADSTNGLVLLYQTLTPPNTPTPTITPTQTSIPVMRTISGNTGVGSALVYYSPSGTYVTSNKNGRYSLTVPAGWSGMISPSKPGYRFIPESRTYWNVQTDQQNQDFVAEQAYTISGNAGTGGVTLSYEENGTLRMVIAAPDGSYSIRVPKHWSGTVTPSKTGYNFSPSARIYANVVFDQIDQNYTANQILLRISGNVGLGNVTLSYFDLWTGSVNTVSSDSQGNYTILVPYNWMGIVTPSKPGYMFTPDSMTYGDVQTDLFDQNYVPAVAHVISGNVGVSGASLSYVDGTSKSVVADVNGNYSLLVSEHWSGTITPSKPSYIFAPSSRIYNDVVADQLSENYTAVIGVTNTNDSGPGSLRQAIFEAAASDTIKFDPSLAGQTITLSSQLTINKDLTIDGSGLDPRVEISGNHLNRMFYVNRYITATLRSLVLKEGKTQGTTYASYGGAIFVENDGKLIAEKVAFVGNSAPQGGAIYAGGFSKVVISEGEFLSNSSTWVGGAIYLPTPLDLTATKTRFANNSSSSGGAVYLDASGRGVFEENVFENNTASSAGGAIASNNSPGVGLQIRRNLFLNNFAGSGGGAISISRFSSTFVIIENNTFYGNQAGSLGGAIASGTGTDLLNNTFSHNRATNAGASLSITTTMISKLYNNIFANSTGGSECYTSNVSGSLSGNNNIVEDGSNPCAAISGTIMADPLLEPLADNGGSTQTMELLPGSPAIDAGDNMNCPLTDERGVARPQGIYCDLGAFEYTGPSIPPLTATPTYVPTQTSVP